MVDTMDGARSGTVNDIVPLLAATLPNIQEVQRVARAALEGSTIVLRPDEATEPGIKYALELSCPGLKQPITVLAAQAGRVGGEPLMMLRPYGAQGAEDLKRFLGDRESYHDLEPTDPFVGRLLGGGRYEILAPISSGSAGSVYRGRHLLLDRPIAIKILHAELAQDPTFTAHFNGEARAASRLDHPNICRVFDFGEDDDGLLYIVMELLEGPEIGDIVEREGAFELPRIIDLVAQVCAALSLAHERGIVHRDVKAENILVIRTTDDDGKPAETVKVCDFGLAMSTDLRAEQFVTVRGACGTPAYMPPEQVRGEPLDPRADVYACGVLLYLLATNHLPFYDDDPRRICAMQLKSAPLPPSQVNPNIDHRLEEVILRAMSKDREARYASARELRYALRELREAPPLAARPPLDVSPTSHRQPEPLLRAPVNESRGDLPLRDPSSGLAAVVEHLATAVSREAPTDHLAVALHGLLTGRGQLTLFRPDPQRPDLYVYDSKSAPVPLADFSPAAAANALAQWLAARTVLVLTIREGIDAGQVDALAKKLRALRVSSAALPHVTIIADHARLGRHRSLPWLVDLYATQVAFVLAMTHGTPATRMRSLVAALRSLASAADARTLLESSDLIAAASKVSAWDVACAVGEAIPQPVCARLLASLAGELLNQTGNVPLDLVRMLARRLCADRTPQSDELLRNLFGRSLIGPDEVPEELRAERRADQRAASILEAPERGLAPLEMATNESTYAGEVAVIEEAMRLLLKQGRLVAFAHCFRVLAKHAAATSHPFRAPIATRAMAAFEEAAFLERLALVLLRGPQASHEAAQSVLITTGGAGAQALCKVRMQIGDDLDLGGRKRFTATLRAMGRPALPAVTRGLLQADVAGDGPTHAVEDLLRGMPEGGSPEIGATALRLTGHPAPQVRRAALGALVATDGLRARSTLASALSDKDEGVQLSALIGLQRVGGLESTGIARIEELLSGGSEEVRIAAAEAMLGASTSARSEATAALSRFLAGNAMARVFRLGSDASESTPVVEAAARSLLKIGGKEGRRAVEQRLERAQGELKRRLFVLLNGAP